MLAWATSSIAKDSKVVSAIAVFMLIDNFRQCQCLASLRLFTDLLTMSIRLQSQTVTLGTNHVPPYLMLRERSAEESECTFCTNIPFPPWGRLRQTVLRPRPRPASVEQYNTVQYKYVCVKFHTISSPIKHASYKAKVKIDM